ncbi:hypothetical protein B0H19DRAFT_1071184 [Mycena capillaripes]|nr:hypothetical protein B0H19DRAFT_1071184 [Mycena capillaripes]
MDRGAYLFGNRAREHGKEIGTVYSNSGSQNICLEVLNQLRVISLRRGLRDSVHSTGIRATRSGDILGWPGLGKQVTQLCAHRKKMVLILGFLIAVPPFNVRTSMNIRHEKEWSQKTDIKCNIGINIGTTNLLIEMPVHSGFAKNVGCRMKRKKHIPRSGLGFRNECLLQKGKKKVRKMVMVGKEEQFVMSSSLPQTCFSGA